MFRKSKFTGPRRTSNNNGYSGQRGNQSRYGQKSSDEGYRPGRTGNFRRASINSRRAPKKRFGENIDQSLFIRKANLSVETSYKPDHTFYDFSFSDQIKRNLKYKNYSVPTPIQDKAIGHILDNRDLIGVANTGTGKTAAFLLPLIDKVFRNKSEKVLIIAPTRELAQQIDNEFRQFAWDMKIFSAVCVGGMPIFKQIGNLRREPNFVIGTPGRLKDLTDRGLIQLGQFTNIVLDEVDRMLDMGFVDEIRNLLSQMPKERQSLFFSATVPEKIQTLINQFLNDPITVAVKTGNTSENVDQDIVKVRDRSMKFFQLQELLHQTDLKKVLIFIETKAEVEKLTSNLLQEGFRADSIHGNKKQHQRQKALRSFKNDEVTILVATDVAARGLDIDDVSHVINYTVPQTYDDYIHRIGRTGRANKKGFALTFVE